MKATAEYQNVELDDVKTRGFATYVRNGAILRVSHGKRVGRGAVVKWYWWSVNTGSNHYPAEASSEGGRGGL